VDKVPDPLSEKCDEAKDAFGGLVLSGGESLATVELWEASVDKDSQAVEVAVYDGLDLAAPLGRDDGGDTSGA
jgi:hypothetical protein